LQNFHAKSFIKHVQILHKLSTIHSFLRQPQQRELTARAIETSACLVAQSWTDVVKANEGVHVVNLADVLLDMQLAPDDLEVSVPPVLKKHGCRTGQSQRLELTANSESRHGCSESFEECRLSKEFTRVKDALSGDADRATSLHKRPPPFHVEIPPKNAQTSMPEPQAPSELNNTHERDAETARRLDHAATTIQATWRGWKGRRAGAETLQAEMAFLGLRSSQHIEAEVPFTQQPWFQSVVERQRRRQLEADEAWRNLEQRLRNENGPGIKHDEWMKVATWIEQHIDPLTGKWPDLPLDGPLESALSLHGMPTQQGSNRKDPRDKEPRDKEPRDKSGVPSTPGADARAKKAETIQEGENTSYLDSMLNIMEEWKSKWGAQPASVTSGSEDGFHDAFDATRRRSMTDACGVEDIQPEGIAGLPLPRRGSSLDGVDLDVMAAKLLPMITEEVRTAARAEAAAWVALKNAELAVLNPKQGGTDKPKKALSGSIKVPAPKTSTTAKPTPAKTTDAPQVSDDKHRPESFYERSNLGEILSELWEHGIAKGTPETGGLAAFVGEYCLVNEADRPEQTQTIVVPRVKAGGKAAHAAVQLAEPLLPYPELSLGQVRHLAATALALPLALSTSTTFGTATPISRPTTALLYAPPGCGKTHLAMAVAAEAGAALFDLSPAAIAGKYENGQSESLVRMVFTAAKCSAPSVIYIDDVEKVFVQDAARAAAMSVPGCEPPKRIRKRLLEEVQALTPSDGVLVIGCSSAPHACMAADETDLLNFFQLLVKLPMPDERSRARLLRAFAAEHVPEWDNAGWERWEVISEAARLADGYAAGQLRAALLRAAGSKLTGTQEEREGASCCASVLDRFVKEIATEKMIDPCVHAALVEWTARAHATRRGPVDNKKGDSTRRGKDSSKRPAKR
jgi:hypothetical protein